MALQADNAARTRRNDVPSTATTNGWLSSALITGGTGGRHQGMNHQIVAATPRLTPMI
jgi:hypothetical protein